MSLPVTDQLTFSTVRIECHLKTGEISTGTGFFFRFLEDGDKYLPAIVTNKHVKEGAVHGRFSLNLADASGAPTGQHEAFTVLSFGAGWIDHPNPDVDLCIFPIGGIIKQVQASGKKLYFLALDKALIPSSADLAQLTALEEIIMIGYPNGIWDKVNNKPIIRRGITATHPNLPYDGKQEFMIDAACFPGSSGSPVFLFNMGSYVTRDGDMASGTRLKLLGVLYAGPQHTATGEIAIVNIPVHQKPVAISRIPNNLGLIIKAQRLLEFDAEVKRLVTQGQKTLIEFS